VANGAALLKVDLSPAGITRRRNLRRGLAPRAQTCKKQDAWDQRARSPRGIAPKFCKSRLHADKIHTHHTDASILWKVFGDGRKQKAEMLKYEIGQGNAAAILLPVDSKRRRRGFVVETGLAGWQTFGVDVSRQSPTVSPTTVAACGSVPNNSVVLTGGFWLTSIRLLNRIVPQFQVGTISSPRTIVGDL
jgi:hypothetical protein